MVSKIAVAACVLIIAVPILLGYGLNFEESTETRYVSGNETNVTQLLRTSTSFDYVPANTYELNGRNLMYTTDWVNNPPYADDFKMFPLYKNYTSTVTSLPIEVNYNGSAVPDDVIFANCYSYSLEVTQTYNSGYNQLLVNVYNSSNTLIGIIPHVHIIDYSAGKVYITRDNGPGVAETVYSYTNAAKLHFQSDNYTGTSQTTYQAKDRDPYSYADITGGWKIDRQSLSFWSPPAPMSEFLMTIDLNSFHTETLPTGTYTFRVHVQDETEITTMVSERTFSLTYYTDGNWYYHTTYDDAHRLIFDPNLSSNTYQIYFTKEYYELRYVGAWPNAIGEANAYRVWHEDDDVLPANLSWARLLVREYDFAQYDIYPTIRMDSALVKGATYQVIEDATYNPGITVGNYNVQTKISSVSKSGSSLVFGGITYNVSTDGKITIGGRSIPVSGLEFSSVQVGASYENRIGNTLVSTTASSSTLYFGGAWVANVASAPLSSETYTVNEWVPGHFAWDLWHGDDFLLAGLLASLAAFIGLSIYGAKSGKKVGALLLICGGAAFTFLLLM